MAVDLETRVRLNEEGLGAVVERVASLEGTQGGILRFQAGVDKRMAGFESRLDGVLAAILGGFAAVITAIGIAVAILSHVHL